MPISTIRFVPGATFGQTTENNDKSFTYRAGLLYLFDVGLAPYVNYATSFLPQTGTTAVARGATPFVPTTGKSFEAGIKYQAPGSSSYITAAYYNLIKNNVLTTDPIYGGANRVQTGQIRSRGVEIEAVATLAAGLKAIASYAYTDARVTESNSTDLDKVPVAVPRNQAALFVDYTFQNGALAGFGMGAGVRYIGENWADPINTFQNPAVTAVDAALHYDYQNFRSP